MISLRRLLLAALCVLLLPLALAASPPPALCRVQVFASPSALPGRTLTIRTMSGCPPHGLARVRLASSLGGSRPDSPPGAYVLRPGQTLRRHVLPWWWAEWLSASGRPYRVPER